MAAVGWCAAHRLRQSRRSRPAPPLPPRLRTPRASGASRRVSGRRAWPQQLASQRAHERKRFATRGADTPPARPPRSKVFTSKDKDGAATKTGEKMSQAKELLKVRLASALSQASIAQRLLSQRYGSAYLITSISLSIVSFSLSYVLISAGVDVASLLDKARGA